MMRTCFSLLLYMYFLVLFKYLDGTKMEFCMLVQLLRRIIVHFLKKVPFSHQMYFEVSEIDRKEDPPKISDIWAILGPNPLTPGPRAPKNKKSSELTEIPNIFIPVIPKGVVSW